MRLLRRIYLRVYQQLKGHYPVGTLVRYHPPHSSLGFEWVRQGLNPLDVGLVVGGWCRPRARAPWVLDRGSLVLFGGKTYDMENWDLEAIDETR